MRRSFWLTLGVFVLLACLVSVNVAGYQLSLIHI